MLGANTQALSIQNILWGLTPGNGLCLVTQLGKVTQRPQGLCAKKPCFCAALGKAPFLQPQGHHVLSPGSSTKLLPAAMLRHRWPEAATRGAAQQHGEKAGVCTLDARAARPWDQSPEQ